MPANAQHCWLNAWALSTNGLHRQNGPSPSSRCRAAHLLASRKRRSSKQLARDLESCQAHAEAARPTLSSPLLPGQLRCGLCYECGFTSLSHLAEHLTGRRHVHQLSPETNRLKCPYCGRELARQELGSHIRNQECRLAGVVRLPSSQRRAFGHKELNNDPRYAPIMQGRIEGGLLKLRPMHMQHTFEAAMLCTEAFQNSLDPPEFGKMLSELRWQAAHYGRNPGSVTRGVVDFESCPVVDTPDVSDVLGEEPPKSEIASLFSGPSMADQREQKRREVGQAWGVWVWIIAEFIPDDASMLQEGTDSMIVGATSLMFHDRLATLEKFIKSHPHLKATDLNLNLFLASQPPSDLDFKRAAFIWWTSVDLTFRRRGIAGRLLQACEAVAASASFWTFFIQADLKQQDKSNSIFPMPAKRYSAALEAYRKAGYEEYSKKERQSAFWSQSCTLMFKVYAP